MRHCSRPVRARTTRPHRRANGAGHRSGYDAPDTPTGAPRTMTLTATQPHPIYLAGKWVDSPDRLEVANPADPATPAGVTYNATEAQYEEAVEAAVAAL